MGIRSFTIVGLLLFISATAHAQPAVGFKGFDLGMAYTKALSLARDLSRKGSVFSYDTTSEINTYYGPTTILNLSILTLGDEKPDAWPHLGCYSYSGLPSRCIAANDIRLEFIDAKLWRISFSVNGPDNDERRLRAAQIDSLIIPTLSRKYGAPSLYPRHRGGDTTHARWLIPSGRDTLSVVYFVPELSARLYYPHTSYSHIDTQRDLVYQNRSLGERAEADYQKRKESGTPSSSF